jgi:EpsI family protein
VSIAVMAHSSSSPSSSRVLLVSALIIGGLGATLGLWELWPVLHGQWTQVGNYNHGYLLLAVSAWLVYGAWRSSPPRALAPNWLFLLPLMVATMALALMELLFLNVPRLLVLPVMLVAAAGLVLGREAASRVLWPAMLLYFALPVWSLINGVLQALTTAVVSQALNASNIVVFIEGNFVYLARGAFEIAEGCSGLNYLIVGMSIGACYGLAFLKTWKSRAVLFLWAVGVTLFSNWLRVYIIIMAGYLTDMQHFLVDSHVSFGWVLFAVMLLPVLWLAARLERTEQREEEEPRAPRALIAAAPPRALAAAALAAVLMAMPGLLVSAANRPAGDAVADLPPELGPGLHRSPVESAWEPNFNSDWADHARYVSEEGWEVELFRAVYPAQNSVQRLIRYRNSFVGPEWRPVSRVSREAEFGAQATTVIEYEGYLDGRRSLIWAWYEVAGLAATGELEAKLFEVYGLMRGRRDAAAVAVLVTCASDCRAARGDLERFMRKAGAELGWQPVEKPKK